MKRPTIIAAISFVFVCLVVAPLWAWVVVPAVWDDQDAHSGEIFLIGLVVGSAGAIGAYSLLELLLPWDLWDD